MTNLNDFTQCKKVRCVNNNGFQDLTVGKEYEALRVYGDNVVLIDDAGDEYQYDIRLFEPVIETVVQDSDEPQAEEIFKDGDKAYCPYVSGQIFTVCRDDRYNKDGLIIVDKFNKEIARIVKGVTEFSKISIIFHATEENRQALQVLHPHIEFEKPPVVLQGSDLCRAMLERGDKYVPCYVSDVSDDRAMNRKLYASVTNKTPKSGYNFSGTGANDWKYAVPFDPRTGLPLTDEVLK